jgi:hypothetical protein
MAATPDDKTQTITGALITLIAAAGFRAHRGGGRFRPVITFR